jgi:DNA-binding NarL/FixJ family response regulator
MLTTCGNRTRRVPTRAGCPGTRARFRARRPVVVKVTRRRADVMCMDDPRLAGVERRGPRDVSPALGLTRRERQVLQLVADGLANRQIGQALYVSEDTVKTHIRHVLAKLQATSRANAVAIGIRSRLIR